MTKLTLREYLYMTPAAQRAHAKALRICTRQVEQRRREWRKIERRYEWQQFVFWARSKRRDAAIFAAIFVADCLVLQALVHWIVNWR